RSAAQAAALDHLAEGRTSVRAEVDELRPPPPNDELLELAAMVARRRAQRERLERQQPGIELGLGR
ncbi:MAG: hypothetical protein ACE5MI_12640, partial [Acidimicrobiia bacterium]